MKSEIERSKVSRLRRHLIQLGALLVIALGLFAGILSPALAETIKTSSGVHGVTGRVTYKGPPEERRYKLSNSPNFRFCHGRTPSELLDLEFRIVRTIEVGAHRGLKGAIVAVADILDEKFMKEYPGTDVVVENCRFSPFTGVIVRHRRLSLENRDADPFDPKYEKGVIHSGHAIEMVVGESYLNRTLFNRSLLEKGSKLALVVSLRKDHRDRYVLLWCDYHGWEEAFFLPVTNHYYAKVADDGGFEIKGVPPGRHRIVAWHPFAGRAEADIVVDELGSAQVNFELRKEKGKSRPSE